MHYRLDLLGAFLLWSLVVLHEGHDHGSEATGTDWTLFVGAGVFLGLVGGGTWFLYQRSA